MTGHSLRLRLIAGGAAAILIALSVAGFGLTVLFERHVTRSVIADLDVHLKQLLAGLDVDAEGKPIVARPPADPRFSDPLSGLYWQIGDDKSELIRSRSLWDAMLALPADEVAPGEVHHHTINGPGGAQLLISERQVTLTLHDQPTAVRAAVAVDLARVSAASAAFARDLVVALGILGLVLAIATSVQVALGLRPLDALRHGIADIRSGHSRRLPAAVPTEVLPLVEEVNGLLAAQEREIERSRGRAADLAHGLKTPLAALAADAGRLRERGEAGLARDIEAVGDAMSRHVDRELARARVRGEPGRSLGVTTELAPLARSLVAILSRTPAGGAIAFEIEVADGVTLPIDRSDLAEVLGNLLDNATRHAKSTVRIVAGGDARGVTIEDDGAGIAPVARAAALERGTRLDQRGEGSGLGLAIVQDVLEAYGWTLSLEVSELGGLKASCRPA
ncbi:signal transduction histidine kinase [Rhodopseudomonas rhenobacensis]|uniref:histidine kinase n=1 Tax=Rhodopseudomonas rhenobacensis TaxID=87461 RepID=A0A7W7YZU5_9BRAD|nr:HAMP domain-containing sensor histidine kinase [Rhodopseudomonas rhenobacensis]MBB5045337.1 signal transduction histidine kinase [Rhodopseudomonas rhenobacensis]